VDGFGIRDLNLPILLPLVQALCTRMHILFRDITL
jgi:hypothetical protein